tara:strand:- start:14172 stop:15461 length:1290 start_codon:yes stop_codon:yes gene_type:complete
MPIDLALSLVTFILVTAVVSAVFWPYRGASPIFWYPIALALMGVGIFLQIDYSHPSDETHILATFVATFCFAIPSIFLSHCLKLRGKLTKFKERPITLDAAETQKIVWGLFFISLSMTLVYFVQTGANMIVLALTVGIQDDYSTIRLAMYAGENYTAAGYFNQFKNFLLPLTSILVSTYTWKRSPFYGRLLAALLTIVCILSVAGTGQRTYLVFSFVASIFGLTLYYLGRKKLFNFKTLLAFFVMFVGFTMMTSLYKETNTGLWEPIVLTFERIFYSQQWAGLVAFQFIYERPIVWLDEWQRSLFGILPGYRGSDLANQIHDFMFQSFRGTAPPTLVGSAYHNGGMILVSFTFAFLGLLYTFLYSLFLSGPRSTARCFGYGALFFYLATFFVGTPKYIFDNGVITFWIFLFLIRLRWRRIPITRGRIMG